MSLNEVARRYHGQILDCSYGHQWPLNLYCQGFVKINIETTRSGKVKMSHVWAETRAELLQVTD